MDAYESILWILRAIVILIVTVVLVMFLALLIPDIETQELTADVIASRIVYSGGTYIEEPGLINKEFFIPDQASFFVKINIQTPIAVKTWLIESSGSTSNEIIYNPSQYDRLSVDVNLANTKAKVDRRELPVLIKQNRRSDPKPGIQVIEVYYE